MTPELVETVPVARPVLAELVIEATRRVILSSWVTHRPEVGALKVITTAGGGIINTGDPELARKVRLWRTVRVGLVGLYVWHTLVIYAVGPRLRGVRWTARNGWTIVAFLIVATAVILTLVITSPAVGRALGTTSTLLIALFSVRALRRILPAAAMSPRRRQALVRLWHAASESLP